MDDLYRPHLDFLLPYFQRDEGIDTKAKAFAFMVGILLGKYSQEHSAGSHRTHPPTADLVKNFALTGKDLPRIFQRLSRVLMERSTESLLSCLNESSRKLEALIRETGHLGLSLGKEIALDAAATNYFILLGHIVSREIFPS